MLISLSWLREIVETDAPGEAVASALTSRGLTVDAVTPAGADVVLDLDVPANRPDALGHRGVAREVAAALGLPLRPPRLAPDPSGAPAASEVSVAIADPAVCGRYTARIVREVRVGPSPAWVVERLAACGLRSINNVVDASNLVLLELGQPVHFFDRRVLGAAAIRVRGAREGEELVTLDGVARVLRAGMPVIAGGERAVALGGIIGGRESEITAETTEVLVEAAWFPPEVIRRTARALGLATDASHRFERGCDPEAPLLAQDLAARLLGELAGGCVAPGAVEDRPVPKAERTLAVRLSRAGRLLGFRPDVEEARRALAAIELAPAVSGDRIEVTVPSWRVDLQREEDLVEEIGRALGYDRVPTKIPDSAPGPTARPPLPLEDALRGRMASLGFHEALNYSLVGPEEDAPFVPAGAPPPISLTNPISLALSVLRRSLAPGLLRAAELNLRHGRSDVRLFEVGRVFLGLGRPGDRPDEPSRAGFVWTGSADRPHWSASARAVDPYDASGLVEDLFALARVEAAPPERASLPGLHPGQGFQWRDGAGRALAWCGTLHPALAARIGCETSPLIGEIDLDVLAAMEAAPVRSASVPRFPAAARDLSLVLEKSAGAGAVVAALSRVPAPAPASFVWVDRYEGPGLGGGEVALTLRVILQPLTRTLLDAETEAYRQALIAALATVEGARLRRME